MKQISLGLFVILIGLFGCYHKDAPSKKSDYELDSLDYIVISSAIEQYFFHPNTLLHRFECSFDSLAGLDRAIKREDIKELLIIDSTINYADSISKFVIKEHIKIDSSDIQLTEKIIELNSKRYEIDNSKITSFKTQLISPSELKILLDSMFYFGYDKLYDKYPDTYGIISLSKPAFNKDMNKAIIFISLNKGPKYGHGGYLWLKKLNNRWIAYDLVFLWVS